MTPGEMRASMIGPNQSGNLLFFLPQFTYSIGPGRPAADVYRPEITRRLMALTLIHGTGVWPIFCNRSPVEKSWKVFEKLRDSTVDFVPYWKWDANGDLNRIGVYATLYRQSRAAVLAVSNLSEEDRQVTIPAKALTTVFPSLRRANDPMDGRPVVLDNGALILDVGNRNFRLILLE
jgi:hypothetical protein